MMVRIAAFLWTLGIISHIVPNAFATKIVQSNTSPKSASNQIPTTSTPLYSLNAAIGIGSRMDFPQFGYDGGDCCLETLVSTYCSDCFCYQSCSQLNPELIPYDKVKKF